jgi:hypothetical protein
MLLMGDGTRGHAENAKAAPTLSCDGITYIRKTSLNYCALKRACFKSQLTPS